MRFLMDFKQGIFFKELIPFYLLFIFLNFKFFFYLIQLIIFVLLIILMLIINFFLFLFIISDYFTLFYSLNILSYLLI